MKIIYSIFLLFLSTFLISITNAQKIDSLGWKGTPIIPVTDFVNPANWHANSSAGDACSLTKDSTDDRALVKTQPLSKRLLNDKSRFNPFCE